MLRGAARVPATGGHGDELEGRAPAAKAGARDASATTSGAQGPAEAAPAAPVPAATAGLPRPGQVQAPLVGGRRRESGAVGELGGQRRSPRRKAKAAALGLSGAVVLAAAAFIGYLTVSVPASATGGGEVSVSDASLGDGTRGEAEPYVEPEWMPDWASLKAQNPDIRAWMKVTSNGTEISEPVVYPSGSKENTYYLKHLFSGAYSYIGCPFVDKRCGNDDALTSLSLILYGHHFAGSTRMFSTLNKAQYQSSFDNISDLSWYTEAEGKVTYRKAFAMEVDSSYQTVQDFDITDESELRSWLARMYADADTSVDGVQDIIDNAKSVAVTITCASDIPNQPGRTLCIFVRTE